MSSQRRAMPEYDTAQLATVCDFLRFVAEEDEDVAAKLRQRIKGSVLARIASGTMTPDTAVALARAVTPSAQEPRP